MAEQHGQGHDDVCAEATGTLCVCECRGTMHGVKHRHGRAAKVMRLAEVKVTATTGPGGQDHDIHAAGGTPEQPTTGAQRRRDPVVVIRTAAQTDSPLGLKVAAAEAAGGRVQTVGDGPTVTHTTGETGALPHDLSTLDDDTLLDLLVSLPAQGRDDEAFRVYDEIERREQVSALPALPDDMGTLTDDELNAAIERVTANPSDQPEYVQIFTRVFDELERREELAAARERAVAEAPSGHAAVDNAPYAWEVLKDPGHMYRVLGLNEVAGDRAHPDITSRADKAERLAVGLPIDATAGELAAARAADSRTPDDRAQMQFAWYRQLAAADGITEGTADWGPIDSPAERIRQQERAAAAAAQAAKDEAARIRNEKIAAGPPGPGRFRNPAGEWAKIGLYLDSYKGTPEGRSARERARLAETRTLGLPDDASDADIKAAVKAYPGSPGERHAWYLAWYRLIGENSDTGSDRWWDKGEPDQDGVPAPRKAIAPANVLKAWDRWDEIKQQAYADQKAGDPSTFERYKLAMARAFGIPDDARPDEINTAYNHDHRTQTQMGNAFIAEYRALGEAAGIDPNDPLRYGPPDRGGRKPVSQWRELTTEEDQRLESLLARGWDYIDAYAEVRNLDPEALRAQDAGGIKAVRRQYDEWVHLQYIEAEKATNGYMLSADGKAAGITEAAVLFSGPTAQARKYASEELKRWWADNPRLTFTQFKAQVVGGSKDRAAAARTRAQSNGQDFI